MHRSRPQVLWGPLLVVCSGAWGDVFSYVARPEPAFQWREESSRTVGTVKITDLRFTSQTWQGIEWKHVLRVFEPPEVTLPDSFVLFITGDLGGEEETLLGVTACAAIGAPFAILYQVPNQPLFGGKREDALIAHTFVKLSLIHI